MGELIGFNALLLFLIRRTICEFCLCNEGYCKSIVKFV